MIAFMLAMWIHIKYTEMVLIKAVNLRWNPRFCGEHKHYFNELPVNRHVQCGDLPAIFNMRIIILG